MDNTTALPGTMASLIVQRVRIRVMLLLHLRGNAVARATGLQELPFVDHTGGPVEDECFMDSDDPAVQALQQSLRETESGLELLTDSRITFLQKVFGLQAYESDLVQCCLACSLDPAIGRRLELIAEYTVQTGVTPDLAAMVFGHTRGRSLPASSPIKLWRLLIEQGGPGDFSCFVCDPFLRNWLLGADEVDDPLYRVGKQAEVAGGALKSWPVGEVVEHIQRMVDDPTVRLRIIVAGQQGSGRSNFAALVLQQFGLTGFEINSDRIPADYWKDYYMHVHRQAFLSDRVPIWSGDVILDRFWPDEIYPWLLQFILVEPNGYLPPDDQFADLRIELPMIGYQERLELWHQLVPAAARWPRQELEELVLRHGSTIGQIVKIGRLPVRDLNEAATMLKSDAARQLGQLAQAVTSEFRMDDLVVSDLVRDALGDFVFEATARVAFWEKLQHQRLFPQGKSLIALFTGSPGTGKSMAAQVIANTLKLDLYRIDLSMTVSKYIGESTKNIERILSRSSNMDVILFFDEADALFGKRTEIKDAHDRYANTDTNYLLQAIENYPGIVLLATNNKSNIDSGFMRRFRYVLDFQKPDAVQRLELWRKMIAELAGIHYLGVLDNQLQQLAESVELTGAQIKFAALSAIFNSQKDGLPLNAGHLLKAIERELGKEGRGINKQVYQTLLRAV